MQTYHIVIISIVFLEDIAKHAEKEMQKVAREAREEVKNSFRKASQKVVAVNALASGKDKPPLPPKYVLLL